MSKKNKKTSNNDYKKIKEEIWFEIDDTEHFKMMEELKKIKLDPEEEKRMDMESKKISEKIFKEFGL